MIAYGASLALAINKTNGFDSKLCKLRPGKTEVTFGGGHAVEGA